MSGLPETGSKDDRVVASSGVAFILRQRGPEDPNRSQNRSTDNSSPGVPSLHSHLSAVALPSSCLFALSPSSGEFDLVSDALR